MSEVERRDMVSRDAFQRMIDEAAEKGGKAGALQAIDTFVVHDMNTKQGREDFKADLRWANDNRKRCEAVHSNALKVGLPGAAVIVLFAFWESIGNALRAVFK